MDTNKILLRSFIVFLVVLFLMGILTMSYLSRQRQILTNYAIDPALDKQYGEYKKDQIIIKFKENDADQLSLSDIQREATKEATPVGELLEMVGIAGPDEIPQSLVQLNEQFPVAHIEQAFTLEQANENVKGVASDVYPPENVNPLDSIYTITFDQEVPVVQLAQQLSRRADIEYAEPNYIVKVEAIPNDTNFSIQWGMHNTGANGGKADADIDAPEAWDKTASDTGNVIVAILDTGVDTGHEDLTNNIWRNTDEPVFNGIDDDNNGFIDDVHGWNFLDETYNISDSQGHGTHVSGIVGGQRNNSKGISGVADKISIMPVKFLNSNGEGTLNDAARGIQYATDNGAKVINCSFGVFTATPPQTLYQAIDYARTHGVMVVTATGNEGIEIGASGTNMYPAMYDLDNIISVASTTISDNFSSFSNYSVQYADLAAPGSDIVSSLPNSKYGLKSGTSMATPFVSGAVALAMSHFPNTTYDVIRNYILTSVDKLSSLNGKVATGGRLNLNKLVSIQPNTPTPIPTQPISTPTPTVTTPIPTAKPTIPADCFLHQFGDADCDNNITLLDYVCWAQTLVTTQIPGRCYNPDFDNNGRVDVLDYVIWTRLFLHPAVG